MVNKKEILERLIELEVKLKRRPTKRDNSTLYFLSRKYFGSWNNLMKKAGYKVKHRQKAQLPKINSKLYYFLGLLSTDGHIQSIPKGDKVMIFTSYKEEREMILSLMKNLFNYSSSFRIRNYGFSTRENYEIYIYSKKLSKFLQNIGIPSGKKTFSIKVPSLIMKDKSQEIWHFIRGVFDGDGSISKTSNQPLFKINMGSTDFIRDLQKIFISRGFNSIKLRQERETLWDLRLNKKEDIKKLYSLIYKNSKNYFYPRKKYKWKQYI